MPRLPICSFDKLGSGSDVYIKTCFVGRSYVGDEVLAALFLDALPAQSAGLEVNRGLPLPPFRTATNVSTTSCCQMWWRR